MSIEINGPGGKHMTETDILDILFGNAPDSNQYQNAAIELHKMFGAFISAGFSEDQALSLIGKIINGGSR